ncbi:hypothetical protein T440DRAFT_525694 [Plenodomus tracheiphilus IPT5]|uniref:FAD/NAD(P)-binding domain-containing protein n=1 Tax=Plenodomus tracheiphilus IPT5 TaxID=1408161 RepID=A0A6A7AMB9_9PLEO|nr:hypothetical protein T440DRAFT_525694 [Plenodomus tracheiphilus IPT5]
MGMAFVDTLIAETKATVAIVDRYSHPGGHWTSAYPFVRLHQPSAFYGVNSRALGDRMIDQNGWNKGLSELATGDEVCAYFSKVMNQTFLPSARVEYYPKYEYVSEGEFRSVISNNLIRVGPGTRIVDATFMKVKVPSMNPPSYEVADNVSLTTPNGLARIARPYRAYTIVGADKTGVDAHLCFQPPETAQNGPERFEANTAATMSALSSSDWFERLEACGRMLRIDKNVQPTMFKYATLSIPEFEAIKRVRNIIRQGRVVRIDVSEVTLTKGSYKPVPHTLYIDCSSDGLAKLQAVPVFDGRHITLQSVRFCQQVFSAAFIAHVEVTFEDNEVKNQLCRVVPHPANATNYAIVALESYRSRLRWMAEPRTAEWLEHCRLDFPAVGALPKDPREAAIFRERLPARIKVLCSKLEEIIANDATNDTLAIKV